MASRHGISLRPLPEKIEALRELALDLRWTWSHAADRLWERLAPELWARTENPWLILQSISERRLHEAAGDAQFCTELQRLTQMRRGYQQADTWCGQTYAAESARYSIAYFCMEYGLAEALPLYSGGLGILAGDHLKTASDLGLGLVAVGLLYQEGYFRQMLDALGAQLEFYPHTVPSYLPITAVRDAEGAWLEVPLELPGRTLVLRVWHAQVGRVSLYLLDSNDPLNSPADRGITSKLYGYGTETRLVQELVLGIGGWRALKRLGVPVHVCHLNEGHAAAVTLERARDHMQVHNVNFWQALWATRAGNVFTTHTPVAAAFDTFPVSLLEKYARRYVEGLGVAPEALLALGRANPHDGEEPFNMGYLAMRTCAWVNGVSALHGEVSRRIFQPLYPRWPQLEVPVTHVTNGVHVPSWDSPWADALWTQACGKGRWLGTVESLGAAIAALGDHALWALVGEERRQLIEYARRRLARQLGQRGAHEAVIAAAARVLDPGVLTLGFARRFTAYKRPNLLLHDPERLVRLLTNRQRPVQIIVAGKAHPRDALGKEFVRAWAQFAEHPEVRGRAVFLEDYDMALAQELVQGVDVWINTPRRPWEACGTSGMKVLVNGGLNLSELDGWWAEAYRPEVGWALGDGREHDGGEWDVIEAEQLYRLLEQEIVPMFYARDAQGVPRAWVARIRASLAELAPRFSSNRMLREYVEQMYLPAARAFEQRCAEDGRRAAQLDAWANRLRQGWHAIRFGGFEHQGTDGGWCFTLQVYLGEIPPEAVAVELYADPPLPGAAPVVQLMQRAEAIPGASSAYVYRARIASERPADHFTPRVVPYHAQARVPAELGLIRWWPDGP